MRVQLFTATCFPLSDLWWKHEDYEFDEHHNVRPVPGSKLVQYDPFLEYYQMWGSEGTSRHAELPYLTLYPAVLRGRPRVLDWFRRYGLLGILQFRIEAMYPKSYDVLIKHGLSASEAFHWGPPAKRMKAILEDGEVVWRDGKSDSAAAVPIDRIRRFFPSITDDDSAIVRELCGLEMGVPSELYAEPWDEIVKTADNLHESLSLAQSGHYGGWDLLRGVSTSEPTICVRQDLEYPGWQYTSLLSALYSMVLQDHSNGKNVRRCNHCGNLFIYRGRAPLYCSAWCQDAAEKARGRERKAAIKALAKKFIETIKTPVPNEERKAVGRQVIQYVQEQYPEARGSTIKAYFWGEHYRRHRL